MRILYDLQLSVVDSYRDGKFLFETDSNVDVASTVLRGIARLRPGWEVVVPVPPGDRIVRGYPAFHGDLPASVKLVEQDMFGDPFVGRHSFDARSLLRALDERGLTDVDYVYTNDPCRALAYKTFFHRVTGKMVPVASRWHWVTGRADRKVPEPLDFVVSQGEGALVSDVCYFDSKFAVDQFLYNLGEHFNQEAVGSIRPKCRTGVAVDVDKMDSEMPMFATYRDQRPLWKYFVIAWCHRLSYYTGWEQVFDALLKLWERRQDFRVVVTDPGNKYPDQAALAARWPFIDPIDKAASGWDLKDYLRLCWRADAVIGNHQVPAIWGGLAITEPMAAFTAPLMPDRDAYREMCFEETREHVLWRDYDDMLRKLEALMDSPELLDRVKAEARKFCVDALSPERYVAEIVDDAERLVGDKSCTS